MRPELLNAHDDLSPKIVLSEYFDVACDDIDLGIVQGASARCLVADNPDAQRGL